MGNLFTKKEEMKENPIIKEDITQMVDDLLIVKEKNDHLSIVSNVKEFIEDSEKREYREGSPTSMIAERAESKSSESARDTFYQEAIE